MTQHHPLANRVTPRGTLLAVTARGTLMGNRGILHDAAQRLGARRWTHPHWVTCRLAFRGRHRAVMQPGRYTELFFLDEAVALAAGHRPCAECRRADYLRYRDCWRAVFDDPLAKAGEMDARLHTARVRRDRKQVTYSAALGALPDGCFIAWRGRAHLVLGNRLHPYAPEGYGPPVARPCAGGVTVLTPLPSVAVLTAGYAPHVHRSALTP